MRNDDLPDVSTVYHGRPGPDYGDPPSALSPVFSVPPDGPDGPPPVFGLGRVRPFALHDCREVLAYGLVLPDGSAVTAQWTQRGCGAVGVWSTPEAPRRLWACALTWLDAGAR
ncbi:hypothetical protein [Pilimelia columellifera]|uniref:Uncharacterized protein n=1 Tax=Pilimelia columellifera subsp. columellifera TaxID=706583 RepID=A0ABP6AK79_9ACTN